MILKAGLTLFVSHSIINTGISKQHREIIKMIDQKYIRQYKKALIEAKNLSNLN
jgi:hypothetical protein